MSGDDPSRLRKALNVALLGLLLRLPVPAQRELARAVEVTGRAGRSVARRTRPPRRVAGRHPVLAVVTSLLVALGLPVAVVPLLGGTDEVLAFAGETFLGVDDLPEIERPAERSVILDANGDELGVLAGSQNRVVVPLSRVPPVLVDALVAVEDADFYGHEGIDPGAIVRAGVRNVLSGEVEQGGSTITQQYVRNALLSPERTLSRKVTEATWAVRLEQRLSKDEILEHYLNITYFGNGNYGVAAASEFYFGRPVAQLDLARSALLVGLIHAPERANPLADPALATERRDHVLDRMVELGTIAPDEARRARVPVDTLLDITEPPDPPHEFYLQHVKRVLLDAEELGATREARADKLFQGGLTVHTTIDPRLQQAAESTIAEHLDDPAADPLAGILSVEPESGAIRAMAVGPKTFGECDGEPCTATKVNPLVTGLGGSGRQPGSAFKPLVLATALDEGLETSWHTDVDTGQSIEGCGSYAPDNYDYSGGIDDMVEGVRESNNVFHVKLAEAVGQENVVDMAGELGVETPLTPDCSLALGTGSVFPLDLTEAYATFANGGVRCTPTSVVEVRDADGEVLLDRPPDCERVLDTETAETVTALLENVAEEGTATGARIDRPVAAKTGTTTDNRDAWLMGYTPRLATSVWVGFEQPEPLHDVAGYDSLSGATLPADLWSGYMSVATEPFEALELPDVSLDRYWRPACPEPPPPKKDKDDKDKGKGRGRGRDKRQNGDEADERDAEQADTEASPAPSPSPSPTSSPSPDPRYAGFDPHTGRLETRTDGDSFEDGHQAEQCVRMAPAEAYSG